MKKLLAFDLDGTLLSGGELTPLTLETLEKCRAAGHYIVVATGRTTRHAQRIMDMIKPHGASLSDGACGYVGDQLITEQTIPHSQALAILDRLEKHPDISTIIINTSQGYLQSTDFPPGLAIRQDLRDATTTTPLAEMKKSIKNHGPYAFVLTSKNAHVGAEIAQDFPDLYVLNYEGFCIIRPKTSDKWYALEKVAQALGVPNADIIAFGDNDNDLQMLTHSGIGVAMGNATDGAKNAADYICDTNKADGVAHWLRNNLLCYKP